MSFGVTVEPVADLGPAQEHGQPENTYFPPAKPSAAPVVAIGLAAVGAVGLLAFAGRRRNPRRRTMSPWLVVGGAAAGLWWLGQRAVAQVRAIVPDPMAAAMTPRALESVLDS